VKAFCPIRIDRAPSDAAVRRGRPKTGDREASDRAGLGHRTRAGNTTALVPLPELKHGPAYGEREARSP
jgi:hypothetical protein